MLIIGIDPGLRHTGWGIVEKINGKLRYIDSGVIKTYSNRKDISKTELQHTQSLQSAQHLEQSHNSYQSHGTRYLQQSQQSQYLRQSTNSRQSQGAQEFQQSHNSRQSQEFQQSHNSYRSQGTQQITDTSHSNKSYTHTASVSPNTAPVAHTALTSPTASHVQHSPHTSPIAPNTSPTAPNTPQTKHATHISPSTHATSISPNTTSYNAQHNTSPAAHISPTAHTSPTTSHAPHAPNTSHTTNSRNKNTISAQEYINQYTANSSKNNNELFERITLIFQQISLILKQYPVKHGGIEKTYTNINPNSSLKLAHARAAAIISCTCNSLLLAEYQAKTIKKTITGYGNATKEQMQKTLPLLLNTGRKKICHDESDALAIAICHAFHL